MAGENVNNEVDAEETDADFLAGVAAHSDVEPTPTPEPSPAPEPSPEPTPEPTPEPEYVQITKQQWEEMQGSASRIEEIQQTTAKQFNTAFGKLGSFEDVLKKLQTATPAGQSVEIAEEDFAEFKEQYPELAEVQLRALNKALGKVKGTADPEAIEKLVAPRIDKVREETTQVLLEVVFPGWTDEVKTPQFKDWLKGQDEAVRALAASDNVSEAAKLLRLYDKAKNAPAPTPAPTAVPIRKRQIAAAVPPKGDNGQPPGRTENDDFLEGLRSVQQR
jgi:hypothetical protein